MLKYFFKNRQIYLLITVCIVLSSLIYCLMIYHTNQNTLKKQSEEFDIASLLKTEEQLKSVVQKKESVYSMLSMLEIALMNTNYNSSNNSIIFYYQSSRNDSVPQVYVDYMKLIQIKTLLHRNKIHKEQGFLLLRNYVNYKDNLIYIARTYLSILMEDINLHDESIQELKYIITNNKYVVDDISDLFICFH